MAGKTKKTLDLGFKLNNNSNTNAEDIIDTVIKIPEPLKSGQQDNINNDIQTEVVKEKKQKKLKEPKEKTDAKLLCSFADEQLDYIKIVAKFNGKTAVQYIRDLVKIDMDNNIERYTKILEINKLQAELEEKKGRI